jgi:hypothetical protein
MLEMKINLSESMMGRTTVLAGMVCLSFSSCKLPNSDAYSKAEWAVHTTVTKDELPVGVSLEHIEDAPMPAPEDIAAGLPSPQVDNEDPFSGMHEPHTPVSSELLNSPSLAALPPATIVHPPVAAQVTTENSMRHALAAETAPTPPPSAIPSNGPEATPKPAAPGGLSYPTPNSIVASNLPPAAGSNSTATPVVRTIPEIEVKAPVLEIKPAVINPTPENHARMMAASTRPPMAPRGGAETPAKPAPEVVASNSPTASQMPTDAPPDNLTQILKLAKRIEETKKKAP